MAAPFSHSRALFITDVGPMRFYVRPGPLKRQLSPLISHGGGIVCRVQEPGAFLLSEPGQAEGIQYIANTYITDCVRNNRRLSPRSYRLGRRAGAPDKKLLWETKGPEEGTGGVREGPAGATPASNDGSPTRGGHREGGPHTGLKSEPAVNGASPGVFTPGTPASLDHGPSTTGAPTSPDHGPSTTGTAASPDHGPSTTGTPASPDHGPSTTGTPATPDHGPSTTGAPASPDHGPSITEAPPSCDFGPSTTGAPVRQDEQVVEGGEDDAQRAEDTERRSEERATLPKRRAAAESGWRGPMRRRLFSREEDLAIFQYVRENEVPTRLVTGTLLWKELEQKGLLCRTWQAMKTRYTKYILQNAHRYILPATSKTARTPRRPADQQRGPSSAGMADQQRGPSSAGAANQHPDLLPADTTDSGGCRLRSESRRVITGGILKTVQDSGGSSWEGGYRGSVSTSMQLPDTQENQDIDSSEEIQIFEIANMEFEVEDEDSGCNVKVPLITLDNPVIGEVIAAPQLQVDDTTSSPDTSDSEGLQDAMADMMKEFKLDVCQVTQALLKNNGEVGSTRVFLRTGLRPDGFPIWEYKDDVELQRSGPAVWPRLAGKYGSDNVAKRVAFLASYTSSVVPQLRP